MSDPKARLTHDQILDAGVDDWRKVLNRLRARFALDGVPLVIDFNERRERRSRAPAGRGSSR